jgi:hypothetical protein
MSVRTSRHVTRAIRGCVLATAVALASTTGHALAQPVDDPKIKKADQLFDEAKQLLDSNLAQACQKFEQSLALNSEALGTLVNVALCDEKLGHYASAAAKFTEARDRSKEQGLAEYVRASEQHLAAVAPLVPHLTIKLSEDLPGTSVLVDNAVVAPSGLASVAVDPGEREIVVSAPDRLPYRTKIIIARSAHQDVVVPALARSVIVHSSRPRIGQLTAIAGGVAAATGLGIGLYARHQYDQQFDDHHCVKQSGHNACDPTGLKQTDHARTLGTVGTIVGVAGIGVAIGGTLLWLLSPHTTAPAPADDRRPGVSVVPAVSADGVGLTALGRF